VAIKCYHVGGILKCRICSKDTELIHDFGPQPLANSLISNPKQAETLYPLQFYFCENCQLGQTLDFSYHGDIFNETYPYYSSVNKSYVNQCRALSDELIVRFNPKSVIEIGCNDGYMLQWFNNRVEYVLGIEPCKTVAQAAKEKRIEVKTKYYSTKTAELNYDLVLCNNVIAHVPDPVDLMCAIKASLSQNGIAVIEIPMAEDMYKYGYWDTIYHEHFSYFSLYSIQNLADKVGLKIFDLEQIPSHGGSYRVYLSKSQPSKILEAPFVTNKVKSFKENILRTKLKWLDKLPKLKPECFGAAAKGISFINYLGLDKDVIPFVVDETPAKQAKLTPKSRIPIISMGEYKERHTKNSNILILPWNFSQEIRNKLKEELKDDSFIFSRFSFDFEIDREIMKVQAGC